MSMMAAVSRWLSLGQDGETVVHVAGNLDRSEVQPAARDLEDGVVA